MSNRSGTISDPPDASPTGDAAAVSRSLLLKACEAAALCNISVRTWRSWDTAGRIPNPVRIGRSLLWRADELREWVEAGCPRRDVWEAMQS